MRRSRVVGGAETSLVTAEATRASTDKADHDQVQTLIGQVDLAARTLAQTSAAVPISRDGDEFGPTTQAEAAIAAAKVQLDTARAQLDDTTLRAPFSGTVLDILGRVGETSAAAARGTAAAPEPPAGRGAAEDRSPASVSGFVVLADLTHKAVTAVVPEAEVNRVRVGQHAEVTFPGTGAVVEGTVSRIAQQEDVVKNVVEYAVKVDLDGRAAAEKLGQSASVVITTASGGATYEIPNSAYTKVGGAAIVTVRRGENLVKVPVTLGWVGARTSQVSSPLLRADDLIVLPAGREGH